jgi:hypothetical protein
MPKSVNHKTKTAGGPATDGPGPESPESLDKVRDILFGGQMRIVETRIRGLEERLLQEQAALRADFGRQLTEAEAAIRKDLKALAAEFREARKVLEKRQGKLEETTALADAELRDQILQQSAALSAEMARVADRQASALEKAATDLEARKLDTTSLVGALSDMAARLGGNGRPAKGGTRS